MVKTPAPPDLPASGQTRLTDGLLAALDRPPKGEVMPSLFKTAAAGLLTAGLWPALTLPWRWLTGLRAVDSVAWHLGEWASIHLGQVEAESLVDAGGNRASRGLAWAAFGLAIVAGGGGGSGRF